MRNTWVVSCAVICVALSAGYGRAAADDATASRTAPAGFPDYSRKDVMLVCLSEYGTGNSSTLDCLADDQKSRDALARKWADIDEQFKKTCLVRLADEHATTYSHLDACVRSAAEEKNAPAPE